MADTIRRVDYFYVEVPDRPGVGADVLAHLKESGVNLVALTGFPRGRRAQIDFVPEDARAFREAARKARWKVTGPKKGFLAQGEDRPGAIAEILRALADAGINVTAIDAVCAGAGRYGALFWVASRDVGRAARVLGVA